MIEISDCIFECVFEFVVECVVEYGANFTLVISIGPIENVY